MAGAARLLAGRLTTRVRGVAELVEDLSERGLRFAAAEEGNEAAYARMHGKLAAYAVSVANTWSPWD